MPICENCSTDVAATHAYEVSTPLDEKTAHFCTLECLAEWVSLRMGIEEHCMRAAVLEPMPPVGRYQLSSAPGNERLFDTATGRLWTMGGTGWRLHIDTPATPPGKEVDVL